VVGIVARQRRDAIRLRDAPARTAVRGDSDEVDGHDFRSFCLKPELYQSSRRETHEGGFPNQLNLDSTMANKRRFAMAAAVGLRGDYDAGALRVAAKRSKDGPQARRLLALAAIYDGASRTEAAKIGGVTLRSFATGW
jgi:hypothetical protein